MTEMAGNLIWGLILVCLGWPLLAAWRDARRVRLSRQAEMLRGLRRIGGRR